MRVPGRLPPWHDTVGLLFAVWLTSHSTKNEIHLTLVRQLPRLLVLFYLRVGITDEGAAGYTKRVVTNVSYLYAALAVLLGHSWKAKYNPL